jgi:3-methyl-2-oxobutanoate hydroxymethyltransferase
MVTAYDEPGGRLASAAGVDLILVGDSLGNVVLGHENTLRVTTDDIAHHTAAVVSARPSAHVVGDLPWMSYHVSTAETVHNAAQIIRAGAQSVKLEGGRNRVAMIEALVNAEIPVMGHLGLTPQSVLAFGGFKVQGKTKSAVEALIDAAHAIEDAGVFALVLEGVPASVGAQVTEAVNVPVIGIGAGPDTDGQVLVWHDLLGLGATTPPKFVRQYADLNAVITGAIAQYVADVRGGSFPSENETYPTPSELL